MIPQRYLLLVGQLASHMQYTVRVETCGDMSEVGSLAPVTASGLFLSTFSHWVIKGSLGPSAGHYVGPPHHAFT